METRKMTRKDFELIAAAIRYTHSLDGSDYITLKRAADALADELAGTNPRFDRERFLKACNEGAHNA
jgi:hypothetical protein